MSIIYRASWLKYAGSERAQRSPEQHRSHLQETPLHAPWSRDVAAPLTRLCGPHAPSTWGPTEEQSFECLKMCLTTAPVLRTFDPRRRSVLTTDASEVEISAVLTQPDDDGVHHPVAYESRKLNLTEQMYQAHVLE